VDAGIETEHAYDFEHEPDLGSTTTPTIVRRMFRGSARRCYCLTGVPPMEVTGPMVSNKTKARLGVRATVAAARHPALRRATTRVGVPTAKVVVKRKMRDQMERIGAAAKTTGSIVVIYGPMAAEVLGLVEAPKPKRRAPVFAAGAVTGGVASYVLLRQRG
jgi:hypothetical protein